MNLKLMDAETWGIVAQHFGRAHVVQALCTVIQDILADHELSEHVSVLQSVLHIPGIHVGAYEIGMMLDGYTPNEILSSVEQVSFGTPDVMWSPLQPAFAQHMRCGSFDDLFTEYSDVFENAVYDDVSTRLIANHEDGCIYRYGPLDEGLCAADGITSTELANRMFKAVQALIDDWAGTE